MHRNDRCGSQRQRLCLYLVHPTHPALAEGREGGQRFVVGPAEVLVLAHRLIVALRGYEGLSGGKGVGPHLAILCASCEALEEPDGPCWPRIDREVKHTQRKAGRKLIA